jgi:predicted DCC family thiol-disulfide oxidoreductase YuxK
VFEIAAAGDSDLVARFPELDTLANAKGMRLVTPDGHVHIGADAVYEITRRLPRWRRVAWIYRIPGLRQVCRAAYSLVARNRHRLGGRSADDACAFDPDGGRGGP